MNSVVWYVWYYCNGMVDWCVCLFGMICDYDCWLVVYGNWFCWFGGDMVYVVLWDCMCVYCCICWWVILNFIGKVLFGCWMNGGWFVLWVVCYVLFRWWKVLCCFWVWSMCCWIVDVDSWYWIDWFDVLICYVCCIYIFCICLIW